MRRLLALAVATAMVVGSLWLRTRDDGDGGGDGRVPGPLRLTCATELQAVCEAVQGDDVEVTVEAAADTARRLTESDAVDLDGWVVPGPWPVIVGDARERGSRARLVRVDGPPLARSPLVLVVWKDRAAALRQSCQGPVGWKCLGEVADKRWADLGGGQDWGPVKLGLGDLGGDATSLLVLGQAVAAYFGRTNLSAADLEDPGFDSWLGRLEAAARVPSSGSGLEAMLTAGPAVYDAVGTIEAEAKPLLDSSARRSQLDLLYPSPMATADVVLATAGTRAARLAALVRSTASLDTLVGTGWQVPGRAGRGLPPPGFLEALRQEVTQ